MHYIVSIPLDPALGDLVGKKGSENSITFYNRKLENDVIVGLIPSSIGEKFYALPESMMIASEIVVSTADLDQLFGEVLIACSLLERHVIFTDDSNIDKFLGSVKIKDYEIAPRSELLDRIIAFKPKHVSNKIRVDVDKAFPVKGLGTIALGIVTSGMVKVHDELYHSSGKKATVRSMQSQDIDITEAPIGTRVGIALKGLEHDEIEKGDILTVHKTTRTTSIKVKMTMSNLAKEEMIKGNYYSIASNFSYSKAMIEEIENDIVKLKLERQIVTEKDDEVLFVRERVPRIFAKGLVL